MVLPGISVAYDALPTTADYETVRADVERQLPLRNLHWVRKSGASRTIRTIQALPFRLRPLETFGDAPAQPNLLERPYLHLLFVVCDDNEVYRATLRTQIREWLDGVSSKQHQEWLIVHVTSGRGGVAKFYQRKGTIVDKIKADFNSGKKDRCIQVVQGSSIEDPTVWAEFLSKVKEGIIATFDSNIVLYEENVRKADSQRQLPGWQFLPFFRQKESLADSFEAMTLYEDALIQYDELEASFFQSLKEHRHSAWYENLGATSAGDDSLPLLSTTNKPYRQLIDSNAISIFDFRTYLFARQAAMLFQLGRTVEIARRGAYFVSTFARTLREQQASLGINFVESWTFSACLSLVDECQRKISQDTSHAGGHGFTAVKAELLDLAKKQLDKIGMGAGHLPTTHPFAMSLNESSPSRAPTSAAHPAERPPVTRQDLLDCTTHQDSFDKLYIDLTHRAIQAYQSSGRKRCALRLHSFLAALEQHRTHLDAAQKLYAQLPAHYSDARWCSIESFLLSRCTLLQQKLEMPKDHLLSTLALVRAGMDAASGRWGLAAVVDDDTRAATGNSALANELMDDVYRLSGSLNKDFAAVAFPSFSIDLQAESGSRVQDEDGLTAVVRIRNHLPCLVHVDEVRLKFATSAGEQVWLTAGGCDLPPGDTPVSVFCPVSVTGHLLLELSQLRFSRIIFQYSHRPLSRQHTAVDFRSASIAAKQPALLVPVDYQAVLIDVEEPDAVHLDQDREAVISVDSGRNHVTRMTLRFASANEDLFFATTRASIHIGHCRLTSEDDGVLVLEDLRPFEVVKLRIPLGGDVAESVVKFVVQAEYNTSKRPQARRHFRRSFSYSIALPLAVNVQDYFRETCLLSKFSVTTDGVQGLRVRSAKIEAPESVLVKPCRPASDEPVFISALQTANFLFKLSCENPAAVAEPMRLVLSYSSLEQQLRSQALDIVDAVLCDSRLRPEKRWISTAFVSGALASMSGESVSRDANLTQLEYDEDAWRRRAQVCMASSESLLPTLEAVQELYRRCRSPPSQFGPSHWRTLEIPLDLPSLQVLSLVRIEPAVSRAEVGQPVPATMFIRTSFQWCRTLPAEPPRLSYDVISDANDWLVSGQARGDFAARDDGELSFPLTFIPLSTAALFLPSVAIQPLAASSGSGAFISCETQHVTAATAVEVLPITHRSTFEVGVPLVVA
ncbi:hypothetical protein JCM6882_005915 [Rhodosporidiobolus microsporus]